MTMPRPLSMAQLNVERAAEMIRDARIAPTPHEADVLLTLASKRIADAENIIRARTIVILAEVA